PEAAPLPSEVEKPAAKATFDPATLPPIESIMAESDIRAFLQPGVPPELSRAALRRAWSSDPAIRNFVGLVENGWDFNDPSAMPGFGAISPEEVARLAGQVIAALPQAESENGAKQAAAVEKISSVASTGAPPAALAVTAEATEPGSEGAHDAAQQNATDKSS